MGSENKGGESENSSSLRQILLCNIIPKFHRMTGEQGICKSEDCSKEMKGQEFFCLFFVIFTYVLILQGQGSVYAP